VNKALPREQAVMEYGQRIKRAGTYKGLNRLIQGSAADQTKAAMVALRKAGFAPILQVHDEVALSVGTREEAQEAAKIMAEAVRLEVPSRCDVEVGPSWGEAKRRWHSARVGLRSSWNRRMRRNPSSSCLPKRWATCRSGCCADKFTVGVFKSTKKGPRGALFI